MSDIGEIKPRRPGSLFAAGIITSVSIVRNRIAEYVQGQSVFYWIDKAAILMGSGYPAYACVAYQYIHMRDH